MRSKPIPVSEGQGQLRFSGFSGAVAYRIEGEPHRLKLGPARVRGSITATPEVALEAFRAGQGDLAVEGGESFRIVMVGHSAGSGEVFIELRV